MDTITINLVRVGDTLVGMGSGDRFNLASFGITSLTHDRNNTQVKRLRRQLAHYGLVIVIVRKATPVWAPTTLEAIALGTTAPTYSIIIAA